MSSLNHPGVFHFIHSIVSYGEVVKLGDGSIWRVRESDQSLAFSWSAKDSIIVTQNVNPFSSYNYCLLNQNRGEKIYVNLTFGPFSNGSLAYTVTWIDKMSNQVILSDGSRWDVSAYEILHKWMPGDTVIIGVNTGWLWRFNPNILINVDVDHWVMAELRL